MMLFQAKKSLGQNFLVNPHIVERIIKAADLHGDELVYEVGPGFGVLTQALLRAARKVVSIEKDTRLIDGLKEKFSAAKNFELIHADALTVPPPYEPYQLIANIPYSITSPLLDHFIREQPSHLPKKAVLLVQKEVAEKICAKPPRMNVLALHVQTFGTPKIIAKVSRNNFRPIPKVDSAILHIAFGQKIPEKLPAYFDIIHRGFSKRRKMLRAFFDASKLQQCGIDPTRRAETLSVQEWERLSVFL